MSVVETPHLAPLSPARAFLCDPSNRASNTLTAFVGADTGFLPPRALPPLPPELQPLQAAVDSLPAVSRLDQWASYAAALPDFSAAIAALPSRHLLRANLCAGVIAHAIQFYTSAAPPAALLAAWRLLAQRLSRPTAAFTTYDAFCHNFHVGPCGPGDAAVLATDTMVERNFVFGSFSIESTAAPLPGLIALAQDAALQADAGALRAALLRIAAIARAMGDAFVSADVRPLSSTYVDHVEFNRVLGLYTTPVVAGEKTVLGTLFPSVHLLDCFLARPTYDSDIGRLSMCDRAWLAPLHKRFLAAVSAVSVADLIDALPPGAEREAAQFALNAVRASFSAEHGLLGRHRMRIGTFIEIGIKVGRPNTAAATGSVRWQSRIWRGVNSSLLAAMRERSKHISSTFVTARVARIATLPDTGGRSRVISLAAPGIAVHHPGDHVAIIPENGPALVARTLRVLGIDEDTPITLQTAEWLNALDDCNVHTQAADVVSARTFLTHATLQPLDRELGQRLAKAMYVTNPALKMYLREERATNFPIALELIQSFACISVKHLLPQLENVLKPLAPRTYSVACHQSENPDELRIVFGRLEYAAKKRLSFDYDEPPWRRNLIDDGSAVAMAADKHAEFTNGCITNAEADADAAFESREYLVENEGSREDQTEGDLSQDTDDVSHGLLSPNLLKLLQEDKKTVAFSAKATSRARVILSMSKSDKCNEKLRGVCSEFLSSREPGDSVRLRLIDSPDFNLPKNNVPIVMFALGSGVAPFLAFLHEVKMRARAGLPTEAWLILGVRTQDSIPFRKEIEELACKSKMLSLSVAISREDVQLEDCSRHDRLLFKRGQRCRINQLFDDDDATASDLWDRIQRGAHLYTCGHPELERVVRKIVTSCAMRFATDLEGESAAKLYADRMLAEKRLHIDTYFSGERASKARYFPHSEIARHVSESSCWTIFRGCVYDVTEYLNVHPGGGKILLDKAGRDMTSAFERAHGADNGRVASMLEPYRIGLVRETNKASANVRNVLVNWAVAGLHDMLETRAVWELDVNEFDLCEPEEFTRWKSPAHTVVGRRQILRKWGTQHEPDLFTVLCDLFDESGRGAVLTEFCGAAEICVDVGAVKDALLKSRSRILATEKTKDADDLQLAGVNAELALRRGWASEFVELVRAVVELVEKAEVRSASGRSTSEVGSFLIEEISNTVVAKAEHMYASFSEGHVK